MAGYGQFCAVARAQEILGGRWTLLVVREMLCGSRRFNNIRRGIPRISRTVLSERLQALTEAGAVRHTGQDYELTEAGRELASLVQASAVWAQRWLPREARNEDIDLEPVLVDMQRRVRATALPKEPLVLRIAIAKHKPRFLLLSFGQAALCTHNPGFPEPITLGGPLHALVAWWRGDMTFAQARQTGLTMAGPKKLVREFPGWFERYAFADIAPASKAAA
ncbi:MAG: helix-turn-helix transcriptional regulator [Rhizobiales bacterium]|nr:helix-turn-helix transcriptional regulator [Hyphomicrobiales bacterium]